MQFTDEVNWTFFDFLVAAFLLLSTGVVVELVLRNVKSSKYRWMICILILAACILTWAELAVGIFNTPLAGN